MARWRWLALAALTWLATAAEARAGGGCGAAGLLAPALAIAPPPLAITPVALRVLQDSLTPVPATDGQVHLAYAAQVTNLSQDPVDIVAMVPVDFLADLRRATGSNQAVAAGGAPVSGKVKLFAAPKPGDDFSSRVPGGGSGIAFFDVVYPSEAALPAVLAHRLEVRNPATGATSAALTAPVPVACAPPLVLQPPLLGSRWWDGNGCCVVGPHRGATLPVNGRIEPPEQFAIDFAQIRGDGTCCTGPAGELASWPFYGAPVLAAASGRVVSVDREEPDQVPGQKLVGVTVLNAAGNNVIEQIDPGHFALYAHLRPGSIPATIVAGALLRAGDRLGAVGNSGSSTAPHLHFQVMDQPSALDATGLPFVFDRQVVEGRVVGSEADADARYEAGGALTIDASGAGPQPGRMPASGQVFAFGPE